MIGLAGLLIFGFSALWLLAAAMSDSPSQADDVVNLALIGAGAGLVMIVAQIVLWLWRML